jgi:tRNA pseudouridine55 synthase
VSEPRSGLLVVDKPAGLTSHGVVARVRRLAGTRRVGHAGTLDPSATGVLVLGVGRGTRLLHYLSGADKEYAARLRLGVATSTEDADGDVLAETDASGLDAHAVDTAVRGLVGWIDQVPSTVSAVKVAGRPAHARVRAGEPVVLEARRVQVRRFDVLARHPGPGWLDLDVVVACSSGTYVRALARDLGTALGVGGHVRTLRRTRVGPFTLADATPLDALPEGLGAALHPLGAVVSRFLPVRVVDARTAVQVRHGVAPGPTGTPGPVALLDAAGQLLAVAQDDGARASLGAVFVG